MKNEFIVTSFIVFALIMPSFAYADGSSCQPIFGGGQTCAQTNPLQIDKQVKDPLTGIYVNNLGLGDPHYQPGQRVDFKIIVTNAGSATVSNATISDYLPPYITYVSGGGNFNNQTDTVTFTIGPLSPKQQKSVFVQGKVVDQSALPTNQGVICIANQATVSTGSQDTATFCIQKAGFANINPTQGNVNQTTNPPVYPPTQAHRTPSTGPETWEIIGLLPASALGIWLRRKTSRWI